MSFPLLLLTTSTDPVAPTTAHASQFLYPRSNLTLTTIRRSQTPSWLPRFCAIHAGFAGRALTLHLRLLPNDIIRAPAARDDLPPRRGAVRTPPGRKRKTPSLQQQPPSKP
ncbi:hypothetical protein B0H17DRAFT_1211614 [Mycena rosella]|uniref:Uncharacterized protein n=1 Tax=Mycena rosella TaxID=1033263 RepID=A0AAD7CTU2_MYCRO|nr:hypothetical protein B0H17DRAFT_1211614 [Mycena rosella]